MDKKSLKYLVWLTQLGFSLVVPPVLCIWGAIWAQNAWGWGSWSVILGILVGLIISFSNGLVFYRMMERRSKKDQKNAYFNRHD